jgi:hypothetical protein
VATPENGAVVCDRPGVGIESTIAELPAYACLYCNSAYDLASSIHLDVAAVACRDSRTARARDKTVAHHDIPGSEGSNPEFPCTAVRESDSIKNGQSSPLSTDEALTRSCLVGVYVAVERGH